MVTRWEDNWAHSNFVPTHVAIAHLFANDELVALIEFRGTVQRFFYTLRRFKKGVPGAEEGPFQSLDEAKTRALSTMQP